MIELFGYDPEAWNEWRLISLSGWPLWFSVAALLGVLAALYLGYRAVRSAPLKRRILLLALRGAGLALAFLLFLMPGLELSHVTRSRSDVALLFDTSASMALPASIGEKSRAAWVEQFLENSEPFLEKIARKHPLVAFSYGQTLSPAEPNALPAPEGEATWTREVLQELLERYREQDLSGVLLFSDGGDNGGFSALGPEGIPNDEVTHTLRQLGVPVHVFFAGVEGSLRDLAIREVNVDEFAFVHNAVTVEVVLSAFGMEDIQETTVTLKKGFTPISSKSVTLSPGKEARVTFRLVPDALGKAVYEVEVPVYQGEAVEENNRYEFVLKVIRDKIRVLQLVGRPSWDERFLRDLLKKDPNVDLISFFILRGAFDLQPIDPAELSLIPFPTEELFTQELRSFDVVIFQNFNFGPYGVGPYLPQVEQYVRQGGALAMIGGDLSFTQGGYHATPVEEVLPVDLLPKGFDDEGEDNGFVANTSFSPVLTEQGKRHPVGAWGADPEAAQERWRRLPPLEGLNLVSGPKPGASVLATHPRLTTSEGDPAPLLVVDEVGEGRSLALLTDSLWMWAFAALDQGDAGDAFRDFWRHAVRWLIKDPDLKQLRVAAEKERYALGETARIQVRAYLSDYSPAAKTKITLSFGAARDDMRQSAEIVTDDDGIATYDYIPRQAGAHEVIARATLEGQETSETEVFVVTSHGEELRDVSPRAALLKSLAEATGGNFYQLPRARSAEDAEALPLRPPRIARVNRRQEEPLWSSAPFLLLPVALLCLEWWLRRRWGYQ